MFFGYLTPNFDFFSPYALGQYGKNQKCEAHRHVRYDNKEATYSNTQYCLLFLFIQNKDNESWIPYTKFSLL